MSTPSTCRESRYRVVQKLADDGPDLDAVAGKDDDPTPWCHGCKAMTQDACDCLPIAENN